MRRPINCFNAGTRDVLKLIVRNAVANNVDQHLPEKLSLFVRGGQQGRAGSHVTWEELTSTNLPWITRVEEGGSSTTLEVALPHRRVTKAAVAGKTGKSRAPEPATQFSVAGTGATESLFDMPTTAQMSAYRAYTVRSSGVIKCLLNSLACPVAGVPE